MLLDCDKRDVRQVSSLTEAKDCSGSLARIVWAQVDGRPEWLYKVYPGGRVVQYPVSKAWTKGRPEVGTVS
jgi:predicted proteasome-type protease